MATIRSELSILLLLAALCTYGQRESLTDDFAYLSAKERTKIAKKERNEAAADTAFKRLMSDGEIAFRNREYADALQLFKDARARRPYNVNPKVKIEDLEALLKREQVAAAETPATEPIEQNEIASETIPATIPDEIESPPKASLSGSLEASAEPVKKSISTAVTVTKRRKSPGVTPVRAKEEQLTGTTADGIEQRIFMQGTARVLERSLSENGTLISYRKVTHEWGAIHYFRGASTITKRKWDEVFSAQ